MATRHSSVEAEADALAPLEEALVDALAFEPSAASATAMSDRVSAAIDAAGSGLTSPRKDDRSAGRRRLPAVSRRARLAGLLAAVLVVGGAGGGILGLYDDMVGSFGGWRTAWDQGDVVGVSAVVDGYRVTIERAYADPNELMLGVTVRDLEGRGWTQVAAGGAQVTDEAGHEFSGTVSTSSPEGANAAANLAWYRPLVGLTPGRHTLHVTIASIGVRDNTTPPPSTPDPVRGDTWSPWHEVAGPWTFEFPITVAGGSVVVPDAVVTLNGAEVRLTQVVVSPAAINASLEVRSARAESWAAIGRFEHGGRSYAIDGGTLAAANQGAKTESITAQANDGTADASGEWTLRIDELVGTQGDEQVRIPGPWILRFTIP